MSCEEKHAQFSSMCSDWHGQHLGYAMGSRTELRAGRRIQAEASPLPGAEWQCTGQIHRALGAQDRDGIQGSDQDRCLSVDAAWRQPSAALRPGARRRRGYCVDLARVHSWPLPDHRGLRFALHRRPQGCPQFEGFAGVLRAPLARRIQRGPPHLLLRAGSRRHPRQQGHKEPG